MELPRSSIMGFINGRLRENTLKQYQLSTRAKFKEGFPRKSIILSSMYEVMKSTMKAICRIVITFPFSNSRIGWRKYRRRGPLQLSVEAESERSLQQQKPTDEAITTQPYFASSSERPTYSYRFLRDPFPILALIVRPL